MYQVSNGISAAVEVSSNPGISNGIRDLEETNNGSSSWFKPILFQRAWGATNAVTSASRQKS